MLTTISFWWAHWSDIWIHFATNSFLLDWWISVDMYIARNNTLFYAFLIAITVESIGVLSLIQLGIIGNPYEEFSVLGAIVGSYLFGIGIVLAGGCATGTWYRAGEGLLGSWVALFFYMTSAAAMKSGFLVPLNQLIAKRWVINDDLAGQLGIPVWYLLVFLVAITSFIVIRELRSPDVRLLHFHQNIRE